MLYSSILTFYLVIFVIVIIPKCVTWDFGDISNRIHALCKLRCDYHLTIGDEFICDQSCQIYMCQEGCGIYGDAVTVYTCSDVCTEYIHQAFNITEEAHSDVRLTQVPKQSCTQGCSYGLDGYYGELTRDLDDIDDLPAPVVESIGHNDIELSWDYDPLFDNLTFFLQKKIIDTNTDWQIHTATTRLPSGNFYVSKLHPYITYQFKIIFEFTTVHTQDTAESAHITTRPHGVPSSSPSIISITSPSTTVISISWEPPLYTNGPLLSYRLTVSPLDTSKHKIQNDVSPEVHAWIFGHLHAGQKYEVFVSAVNEEGEGPAHSKVVTTPSAGNLSEHETPYLILGADNMVVKLRLLELVHRDAEPVLIKPKSILVTGVGVLVDRQLALVADDTGVVTLTSLSDDGQAEDIYPMLIQPTAIDIDWLHDHAYIVDGYRVFQCSIRWIGNQCKKVFDLAPNSVREIKVDPINGFLYFTTFDLKGLFRKDLAHFHDDDSPLMPLIDSDLHTFVLDYDSFLLYIPNNPQNTIMSAYLDGTGLTDVRRGTVVRPYFINIASMVMYDGKFFWTNGSVLYSEEFDKNRTYYHNALALLEKHFCGFNLYYPKAQPIPIPTNPPDSVQVLFTAYKAIIQWDVPQKLQFQGDGAYKDWFYEVNILQDDGSHNEYHQTGKQLDLVVTNLVPDTQYKVKVRAKSTAGTGPWSEIFNGRTLKEELDSVELLVAVCHQYKICEIRQFGIDGEDEKMLVSPVSSGITDLVWFQDKIFWTSEKGGDLFMFDGTTTKKLDFVTDASCIAIDWLAEKIYWSIFKNGVIKRADMYGQSVEFVYQALARDIIIDSVQGRIYWVTMNSMETANLNGDNSLTYFSVPYFSGNYVMSLATDLDLHKVFWYVKGFENEDLYMADMVGYGNRDVIQSVKLVANFQNIAKFSVLKYFSSRLFWLDRNKSVTMGDTQCNYSSSLSGVADKVTLFNIRHPSLQPYPDKLNSSTVHVIPGMIPAVSVKAVGSWSHFNVTWQPSIEVNHGQVSYEVSLEADYMMKIIMITQNSWYDLQGLDPYSLVTVTVRGYTYWGLGPMTTTTIRSPMSVPGAPQVPRVYVTQRKNAATSKVTLAADFRWTEPESINGELSHQHVFYWKSSEPHQISSTTLSASARHFILDGLEGNTTYFFQVEACTEIGCGPKSVVANATADAVNPVPKLLIATDTNVFLAEADNIVNTSVTIATRSTVAMAFLAQEDVLFWISRDMYLEEYHQTKIKRLFQLEGTIGDLAIDWISRTLFLVENTDSEGHLRSYELDKGQQSKLMTRTGKMGNVVLDPYTSSIIWSEQAARNNMWQMYQSHITGKNITRFFSDYVRSKRAVNAPCSCHSNQGSASTLAMDLSQDGLTKVIFVDESNNIVAADVYGCHCQTLLATTAQDTKGLPPDILTVDHVHIYWYNKTQGRLYMLDKESGKVSVTAFPEVKDIFPHGAHLQPLPASECLDTSPYTEPVDIVSMTNTSVTVRLHPITWPDACENISQPSVRYTVYYRKLDDMNPSDHCGPAGQQCFAKESYSREITIDDLDPYTYYIIQGAVSNYYTQYSATSLGHPTNIRTKPGVPSAVGNITASPKSPNRVLVMWPPPINPNGPLDRIEYYIRWTTQTKQGISKAVKTDAIKYDALDPYNNGFFSRIIENLSPSHIYSVQVICNQTLGNFVRESMPVHVMTFDEPDDIHLVDLTNTTISVRWMLPSDDSVSMFSIHYARVHEGNLTYQIHGLPEPNPNFTVYNTTFENLQPNTEYSFILKIIYRGSLKVYSWPQNGSHTKYYFKTLTGIPGFPEPPVIEEITNGEFEVRWVPPNDFGENITHYLLQYRHIDKENWSFAVNTTDTRWVLDDGTLPRGFTYVFRVQAQNKNGWGPYSLNSSMFSYPILQAKSDDTMMTVVAIVCALLVVVIAFVIIAVCFSVCRSRREERKKKNEFIAVARGPDLELATLRELPTTVIHENNALYAINMVPTDDDIAALPHFRRDQLVLCKFLGSGAFGEVFEGVAKNIINENSGDTKVAVKTLRKSASDQEKEEFLKEALLMSNFRHAHILSLLGVCLDNDPQFIILELMEGGDLLSFMRACRLSSIQNRSELSLTDLVKICVHVARGCKYLEDMHFVHRDLAARNCLVSSCNPAEMVVKIGDFGLARDIYKNDYYRKEGEGLLPVRWMSPESLMDGVFTTQSDIWAFGVLMWEVVTFGQQPYPARTNIEVLHFVRSGGRLDRPDNCPEDFYQLMCKCWSFASEDRPSFSYLLQQLEQFQETCASISEYLVPIRSSNQPIAAVAGYNYLMQRRKRMRSTSSDGAEYYPVTHTPYGSHRMYGSIRRATSFDSPEPKDATQQICTDSSNYLEPKSCGHAKYIEFLPDDRTKDYMYNSEGERIREINNTRRDDDRRNVKVPLYVQTSVEENEHYNSTDNMKYLNQKSAFSPVLSERNNDKYFYMDKNITGRKEAMYHTISIPCTDADKVSNREAEVTVLTNQRRDSSISTNQRRDNLVSSNHKKDGVSANQNLQISAEDVKYATIKYTRGRKQRLDSSTSCKSFDSVQTEPAYYPESQTHRNILNSSSSSRSNHSMSHIPEHAPIHSEYIVTEENDENKYWANNNSSVTYAKCVSAAETRGYVDYLNTGRRSQVYPESAGVLAGYDIIQSSLV